MEINPNQCYNRAVKDLVCELEKNNVQVYELKISGNVLEDNYSVEEYIILYRVCHIKISRSLVRGSVFCS